MVHTDAAAFHALLRRLAAGGREPRILALCGAGLSAASGLPTFRGATAALWHTHDPMALATPDAFARDPGLVWCFYAYRRRGALYARPNAGHRALAALARADPNFLCLTQNVDGLASRAGHPPKQLHAIHGSIFDLQCASPDCTYRDRDNFAETVCPALADAAADDGARSGAGAGADRPIIPPEDLPHCPACAAAGRPPALLRPGVVWFGEMLDRQMIREIDEWIAGRPGVAAGTGSRREKIDLMLIVGTTAELASAVGYIMDAREAGAVLAVVNLDADTRQGRRMLRHNDFAFAGSAAELLPQLLEPLIGQLEDDSTLQTA